MVIISSNCLKDTFGINFPLIDVNTVLSVGDGIQPYNVPFLQERADCIDSSTVSRAAKYWG